MPAFLRRILSAGDATRSNLVGAFVSPLLVVAAWGNPLLMVLSLAICALMASLAVWQIRENFRRYGYWHPDARH